MDRDAFDGLAKLLASSPNRRAALGALLGAGLAGVAGTAEAARKNHRKRRDGKKGRNDADVAAQAADCLSPGPSANISGCPFQDEDFSGDDLSGSKMVGTNFRRAELVGTNLSSSNAKNAIFREADLTCANLRSSTVGGADFRAANLTGTNLKSSGGCNAATFNTATHFCGTVMCDGSVRDDDCAGGLPPGTCCPNDGDCGASEQCIDGACVCSVIDSCQDRPPCGDDCRLTPNGDGPCVCADRLTGFCDAFELCDEGRCPDGFVCFQSCCPAPVCHPPCGVAVAARSTAKPGAAPRPRIDLK